MTSHARFLDAYFDHFTRDPNVRVMLGVDRDLGALPDPSREACRARVAEAEALRGAIETIDHAGLSFDDRLDLELADLALREELERDTNATDGRTRADRMPAAADAIGDPVFSMIASDPRPPGDRLRDITDRLEKVPDYLDALLGRLDRPLARWVEIDREETAALGSLFDVLVGFARTHRWPDAARLDTAIERAAAAVDRYLDALAGIPTGDDLHIGREAAERWIAAQGIDLSIDDLLDVARRFLEENGAQIEALRARLVRRYELDPATSAAALQATLERRFAVPGAVERPAAVLDEYQHAHRRLIDFSEAHGLFPIPADQTIDIVATPDFLVPGIPTGAMRMPAPFRAGTRTSLVYVTVAPERVAQHHRLFVAGIMLHEGIPGHHLQLAHAADHSSLVRRLHSWSDQAEGWTTMLEESMLDAGFMGSDEDEARFITKLGLARLGARVAIDIFFMTGDRAALDMPAVVDRAVLETAEPFTAAATLLQAVTGKSEAVSRSEVDWYSRTPGIPLSYLTGNHLTLALKRDVAAATGLAGLDLDRRFHEAFLAAGNMPVSFLRRTFEAQGLCAERRG